MVDWSRAEQNAGYNKPQQAQHDLTDAMDQVEKVTGGTLPTDNSLSLSSLDFQHHERRHAARLMARDYTPSPVTFFKPYQNHYGLEMFVDPRDPSGKTPMTLSTANRMAKLYTVQSYMQLLKVQTPEKVITGPQPRVGKSAGTITTPGKTVDPHKVVSVMSTISKYMDGDGMSFRQALTAATYGATTFGDHQLVLFDQNLAEVSKHIPDPKQALQTALGITAQGGQLKQGADGGFQILSTLNGDKVYQQAVAEAHAYYTSEQQKNRESIDIIHQDIASGEVSASDPGVKKALDTYQLQLDSGSLDQQFVISAPTSIQDLIKFGTTTPIPSEYKKVSDNIVAGYKKHQYEIDHNAFHTVTGFLGDASNFALDKVNGAVYGAATVAGQIAREFRVATGFGPGHETQAWAMREWAREAQSAHDIFFDKKSVADALQDDGAPAWIAYPTEMLMSWYDDPLIIAGKYAQIAKASRFIAGGEVVAAKGEEVIKLDEEVSRAKKLYEAAKSGLESVKTVAGNIDQVKAWDEKVSEARKALDAARGARAAKDTKRVMDEGMPWLLKMAGVHGNEMPAWGERVGKWLNSSHLAFGYKTPADFMLNVIRKTTSDRAAYATVLRRFKSFFQVDGIDPLGMRVMRQMVKEGIKAGKTDDMLKADINNLFRLMFGMNPAGQVAGLADTLNLARKTVLAQSPADAAHVNEWLDQANALDANADIISNTARLYDRGTTLGRQVYIPKYGGLSYLKTGLSNLGGDTFVGQGLRALTNRVPSLTANVERDFDKWIASYMTRSRVWTRNDIERFRTAALDIASNYSGGAREVHFISFMEKMNEETTQRIAASMGVKDPELLKEIVGELNNQARDMTASIFGVDPAAFKAAFEAGNKADQARLLTVLRKPLSETQLINEYAIADPSRVRQVIQDNVGLGRSIKNQVVGLFGGEVPEVTDRVALRLWGSIRDSEIAVRDRFLRIWKPSVVVTPRYVLRVVATDENMRILADIGFLHRMESFRIYGKTLGKTLNRASMGLAKSIQFSTSVTETERVQAAVERAGFDDVDHALQAMERELKYPGMNSVDKQMLDALDPDTQKILADTVDKGITEGDRLVYNVGIPDPWEIVNEADVNMGRTRDQVGFASRHEAERGVLDKVNRTSKGEIKRYGEVDVNSKEWAPTLEHILVRQFRGSQIVNPVLRDLAEGVDSDTIIHNIVKFFNSDEGADLALRMGLHGPDAIEQHARSIESVVRQYTMDNPDIARMALNDDPALYDTLRELKSTNPDKMPTIHGFKAEMIAGRPNPLSTLMDGAMHGLLEWPTNVLNRQPYFRAWFTKMRAGLLQNAKEEGIPMSKELLGRIDSEARVFAIERSKRILFDFSQQSRFGEMATFFLPFFQPYAEAFQVWGHLLKQNPALIGYIHAVAHTANESGFIHHDPLTGEITVPMDPFGRASAMLNMAFGKADGLPGFSLSAPLNSLNFFFNSTFDLPMGSIAGELPVPVPSFSPPALAIIQKLADKLPHGEPGSWKNQMYYDVQSYLYQYGKVSIPSLLPTWLQHYATSLGASNNSVLDSQADDFLRLQEAQGVTPQSYAQQHHMTVAKAKKQLAEQALGMAKKMEGFRTLFSLFLPAAPSVHFPTEQLDLEWRNLVGKDGWDKARDEFLKRHPDNALITIPTTYWSRPGSEVGIPANTLTDQLLNAPGFAEFAKAHPRFAFALLPKEVFSGTFDRGLFFAQIDQGYRTVKNPMQFENDADKTFGWEAWRAVRDVYDNNKEWLAEQGFDTNDVTSQRADAQYKETVRAIKRLYPTFGSDLDSFDTQGMDPKIYQEAKVALQNKIFAGTELGQGMAAYFAMRDPLAAKMKQENVSTIDSKGAEILGVPALYKAGVASITKAYPDFQRAYDLYFKSDLQNIPSAGDAMLAKLPDPVATNVMAFEKSFDLAKEQVDTGINSADQSLNYIQLRDLANSAYTDYPPDANPMKIWWATQNPTDKQSYYDSALTRPYQFLSRFDRETVLKEPTTDQAEQEWLDVGTKVTAIEKLRHDAPGASLSSLYDAVNLQIQAYSAQDPVFAQQVAHANEWGWGLREHAIDLPFEKTVPGKGKAPDTTETDYREVKLGEQKGTVGNAWSNLFGTLSSVQAAIDQKQLHGEADSDPAKRALYASARVQVERYIEQLGVYSPEFARQWNVLENQNGSSKLLDDLFPTTYFRLGGYPTSKAVV